MAEQGQRKIEAMAVGPAAGAADSETARESRAAAGPQTAVAKATMMAEQAGQKSSPMTQMQNWLGIIIMIGTILATNGISYLTLRADISEMRGEIAGVRDDTRELRAWAQSRFDRVDDRFDRVDERFAGIDDRLDAMQLENVKRDERIETLARMIILSHGEGAVTRDELIELWLPTDP